MKQFIVFTILVLFVSAIYGEDKSSTENLMKVNAIIDSGTFLNPVGNARLQEVSKDLTPEWKMLTIQSKEKNGALGCLLNGLIPSLGSWIQGDVGGALTVLIGVVGGGIVYGVGVGMVASSLTSAYYGGSYSYSTASSATTGAAVCIVGGVIMGAFYVVGLIVPFTYADWYNKQLRRGLGLAELPMTYEPKFAINDGYKPSQNMVQFDLINYRF